VKTHDLEDSFEKRELEKVDLRFLIKKGYTLIFKKTQNIKEILKMSQRLVVLWIKNENLFRIMRKICDYER